MANPNKSYHKGVLLTISTEFVDEPVSPFHIINAYLSLSFFHFQYARFSSKETFILPSQ